MKFVLFDNMNEILNNAKMATINFMRLQREWIFKCTAFKAADYNISYDPA